MSVKTIYISIGNSDDKLTQMAWSAYVWQVAGAVRAAVTATRGGQIHGEWYSASSAAWQNACWCLTYDPAVEMHISEGQTIANEALLRRRLAGSAGQYGQDSIAWAEAPVTEFIAPAQ